MQLQLYVKDYPNGPERSLGEVCGATPSWTPDGKYVLAAEQAGPYPGWPPCRLVRIPANGKGPRLRLANEGDQLALTNDGSRLAYAAGHIVKTVALDSDFRFKATPNVVAKEPHEISTLHWSASGDSLLYQAWTYTKAITNGTSRVVPTSLRVWISQLLPDGSALAVQDENTSTLWRHDVKANTEPQQLRSIPWTDDDLTVSPSGDQLAFTTTRNGAPQIWLSKLDGKNTRVLVRAIPPFHRYGDRTGVDGLSWSPDGKWIALSTNPGIGHGDTSGRIFVVPAAGGAVRKLANYGSWPPAPLWALDSSAVYVSDYKDKYFSVNIATGRLASVPKSDLPAPSPYVEDGRYHYYVKRPDPLAFRIVKIANLLTQTQKAR